jgi:hypothetical protein
MQEPLDVVVHACWAGAECVECTVWWVVGAAVRWVVGAAAWWVFGAAVRVGTAGGDVLLNLLGQNAVALDHSNAS